MSPKWIGLDGHLINLDTVKEIDGQYQETITIKFLDGTEHDVLSAGLFQKLTELLIERAAHSEEYLHPLPEE